MKKRAVAYCRVSTEKEEQLHSLKIQQEFFEKYCKENKILWQPEARKYIDKIIVLENSSFEIYYKDGDTQFYKENIIKFI